MAEADDGPEIAKEGASDGNLGTGHQVGSTVQCYVLYILGYRVLGLGKYGKFPT